MNGNPKQGHKSGRFVYNYFRYQGRYHMQFDNLEDMSHAVYHDCEYGESYPSTKHGVNMASYVDGVEVNAEELLDWARDIIEATE